MQSKLKAKSTPKYKIGDRIGKKKPCASLKLPNKTGTVVGFVEKTNKRNAVRVLYVVELDGTKTHENWDPSVVYPLNTEEPKDRIAFP